MAHTLAHEVTRVNPGRGCAPDLVSSLLLIGALKLGLPVCTTHVSCGASFGIGTLTGRARWKTIRGSLLAWAVTLPLAASRAALFVQVSSGVFS